MQLATRLLAQVTARADQIEQQQVLAQRREAELKFKDAKLEKVNFELARLKAWKFAARTERMIAVQQTGSAADSAAEKAFRGRVVLSASHQVCGSKARYESYTTAGRTNPIWKTLI